MDNLGYENRIILTDQSHYYDGQNKRQPSASPVPPGDDTSRSTTKTANAVAQEGNDPDNWIANPNYLLWAALEAPGSTTGKVVQKPDPQFQVPAGFLTPGTQFPGPV